MTRARRAERNGRDGSLFVTYADQPGPNRMTDGAVWKLDTATDRWTEVTPEKPAPAAFLIDHSADPYAMVETESEEESSMSTLHRGLVKLDERSRDIIQRRWLRDGEKATLQELADLAELGKSGMNHRLARLVRIAKEIRHG